MSSSTFEVREPESESEKVLEFGLDTCEENGLEASANVDGEVPKDHTYTKEPDVDENDDVKDSDSEEISTEAMEVASPKKRGGRPTRGKKVGKLTVPKGKAKKEVAKKEPTPRRGKKKEVLNDEANTVPEEIASNGEAEVKEEIPAPVEETPKSAKRGKKRKVEEKENVIDQSIVEEVQNITEDPAAVNETSTESPSKRKKTVKEEKTPKAKRVIPKAKVVSGDVTEDRDNLPKGWVRKTVVRKSGKTAGMIDVYIYSPEGLKFRSKPDVAAYLARTKSALKIDDFDFSKRKSISTNSPKTPVKTKSTPAKAKEVEKKKAASPKKGPKLVVKISVSKKKKNKTQKTVAKGTKQSKSPPKAVKAKTAKPKANKKRKAA